MIKPGRKLSPTFRLKELRYRNLKLLCQAFYHYIDTSSSFDDSYWRSNHFENILTNSVKGYTIIPREKLGLAHPQYFLDTLQNYTSRSLELGWIKEETAADKYTEYFTSAKTELEQNIISAVHNTLNNVLRDVETDSGSVLTSEAYALLRYNTEYLLEKLPGR